MASSLSSVKASSTSASASKRYGPEYPRLFTPPLREITPETSAGFSVIAFAEDVLGVTLMPWQCRLLKNALELLPDGSFRFRTVVVLVARQNGKSTLGQVLALWFLYVRGVRLIIGTAQSLDIASEVWRGAVELAQETDALAEEIKKITRLNSRESLELVSGSRYKVAAASRRAGRGLSGDLILLDELREHQSWDAWGAITKTTMAREDAQIWALSNAGDVSSVVLRYLRKMAHKALGDPDGIVAADELQLGIEEPEPEPELELQRLDDSLGLFEWSARPGCDIWDLDGWAEANPSLGWGISERTIRSAAGTDPEWVFRTEVLCQWSEGTLDSVFPPGAWDAGVDPESRIADGSPVGVCVDVSWNRGMSYVAVAGFRDDGRVHVEVVAARAGTDWVTAWLVDPARPVWSAVALQAAGAPVSSLLDKLKAAERDGVPLPVRPWGGPDIGRAHGDLFDMVVKRSLMHRPQPPLDVAAQTAVTRPVGDGVWAFDRRRSPRDCSPLIAVTGAAWLMQVRPDETRRPQVHEWPDELLTAAR